jgi:O-antigen/teichoic acid export membrane protein
MLGMQPGTIRDLLSMFSLIIVVSIFLYISMYRTGYRGNVTYEKRTMKKLLIPLIISVALLVIIITAMNIFNYNPNETDNELVDVLISAYINIIPLPFVMFFGIIKGYKKREKERQELMSKKQDYAV